MNYTTSIGAGFALTFFTIVISGFLLSVSTSLALVGLVFAFILNAILFASVALCAAFNLDFADWDISDEEVHP